MVSKQRETDGLRQLLHYEIDYDRLGILKNRTPQGIILYKFRQE
jgi:hypothetical protein